MADRSDLKSLVVDGMLTQLAGWEGHRLHWAWSVMTTLVTDAPEIAWPILLEIVERADDRQLAYLGAGDLEELLAEHGRTFIDRVEARAAVDPRFRLALGSVWQNAMSNELWARVQAVADRDAEQDDEARELPRHRLELRVAGLPPGSPGSPEEEIARRAVLLRALLEATTRQSFELIGGPAAVEIRLEPGVTTHASFDPCGVAAAILETISAERPPIAGLEAFANVAAIRSPEVVWDLTYARIRDREDGYRLDVRAMPDTQVEVVDDATDHLDQKA